MTRARFAAIAVAVMVIPAGGAAQSAGPQAAAVDAALQKVAPSLVRIHVVTVDHSDGREIKREA